MHEHPLFLRSDRARIMISVFWYPTTKKVSSRSMWIKLTPFRSLILKRSWINVPLSLKKNIGVADPKQCFGYIVLQCSFKMLWKASMLSVFLGGSACFDKVMRDWANGALGWVLRCSWWTGTMPRRKSSTSFWCLGQINLRRSLKSLFCRPRNNKKPTCLSSLLSPSLLIFATLTHWNYLIHKQETPSYS